MDATAAPIPSVDRTDLRSQFGAGRLFLADSQLAFRALNQARLMALNRTFGVSREQANLLTFVLALGAANTTYETTRRVRHAITPGRGDAAMGGFLLHEAAAGIAGPAARKVPFFGTLLGLALVGGVALPGLRRAARSLRAAEHRARAERIRVYQAATRASRA